MQISSYPPLPIRAFILITAICLALPVTTTGATTQKQDAKQTTASSADAAGDQDQVMEEVTVIGQKQIFSIRHQIIQAEDHAYEIFNALNKDDDYDIHCQMVARTGTHIRKRMCLPNFYNEATAGEAKEFLAALGGVTDYTVVVPSTQNVFAYKFPIFKAKVKQLALKNPEMLDALKRLIKLNQELKETRDIYYHGNKDK